MTQRIKVGSRWLSTNIHDGKLCIPFFTMFVEKIEDGWVHYHRADKEYYWKSKTENFVEKFTEVHNDYPEAAERRLSR